MKCQRKLAARDRREVSVRLVEGRFVGLLVFFRGLNSESCMY